MLNPYAPQGGPAIGRGMPGLPSRAAMQCPAPLLSARALQYSTETRRTLAPVGAALSNSRDSQFFALPLDDQFGVYYSNNGGRLFAYDEEGFATIGSVQSTLDSNAINHCALVMGNGDVISPSSLSPAGAATLYRHSINRDTGVNTRTTFATITNGTTDDGTAFSRSNHGGTWNHNYPNLFLDEQDNLLVFGGMDVGGVIHYGVWRFSSGGDLLDCRILFTPTKPPRNTIGTYRLDVIKVGRYYHLFAQSAGYTSGQTNTYVRVAQLVSVRDDLEDVILVASGEGYQGSAAQTIAASNYGYLQYNADARSLTVQLVGSDNWRNKQYESYDYVPHSWQFALAEDGKIQLATNNRIVTRSNETRDDGSWHIMSQPRLARVPDGSLIVPTYSSQINASLDSTERMVGTDLRRWNRSWNSRPALYLPAARYVTLAVTDEAIVSRFEAVYSTALDADGTTGSTDAQLWKAFPLHGGLWLGLDWKYTSSYQYTNIQLYREV